jgi:hypothetical protein
LVWDEATPQLSVNAADVRRFRLDSGFTSASVAQLCTTISFKKRVSDQRSCWGQFFFFFWWSDLSSRELALSNLDSPIQRSVQLPVDRLSWFCSEGNSSGSRLQSCSRGRIGSFFISKHLISHVT